MIDSNIIKSMLEDERKAVEDYRQLAQRESNPSIKRKLMRISNQEKSHYIFWLGLYKRG